MDFSKCNIGLGITGSFCMFSRARKEIERLTELGANVIPIFSFNAQTCDTRFGSAKDYVEGICDITGNEGIRTICAAEPIGPNNFLDIMVIAPCTGATLARLAAGLSDTPVTLAAKSLLRVGCPVLVGVSTNDGLGASWENMARLYQRKHYYFVPYGQDDPTHKPNSLKADFARLPAALDAALAGRQLQPVLLQNNV